MKRILNLVLSLSVAACCDFLTADVCLASPAPESDLLAANSNFYAALNSMFKGDTKAMELAWSHSEDVSYMGPDGLRLLGWDAVRADWTLQASKRLGGAVQFTDMRVQPGDTISVLSGIEVGENMVDGKPQKVSIRATNVFRKEDGKWKMIAHHTDMLPFLVK